MSRVRDASGAILSRSPSITDSENFTATGTGNEIQVGGRANYAVQVVGVGAAASAWDVRLEGSLDGVNWTQILQHQNTDGDGVLVFSASPTPVEHVRINVNSLTLGSATSIDVNWVAT